MGLDDIYNGLSEKDQSLLTLMRDPVLWTESILMDPRGGGKSLVLRSYQKDVLSARPDDLSTEGSFETTPNRLRLLRFGRRLGKTISLASEALFSAVARSHRKVAYISPYESQCELFFKMLEALMSGSVIKPIRFVRKPFIAEFANSSIIRAYTGNVRNSRKGSPIRGIEVDNFFLDEIDHGLDEIIDDVIFPIFLGNKRSTILAASTPSGARKTFWRWANDCKQPPQLRIGVREFYHPWTHSPDWTPEIDRLARVQSTADKYLREYMAEFGDALEGVFRHTDLDAALKPYKYNQLKYNFDNKYIMGVDWNETFGVSVVILEQNKDSKRFRIFYHEIINKQEFTQTESTKQIIRLHAQFPCHFLYVDKGFGNSQCEWLRKFGQDHPETKLDVILRPIDYGGNIEIMDPITKGKLEKPAKAFMVFNSQLQFENKMIDISEDEDSDNGIITQAREFMIKGMSSRDVPVFVRTNKDHSLNALMLALLGFRIEFYTEDGIRAPSKILFGNSFPSQIITPRSNNIKTDKVDMSVIVRKALPNMNHIVCKDIDKQGIISKDSIFRLRRPKRSTF